MKGEYRVICWESKAEGACRDQYTLATAQVFPTLEAAVKYASAINPHRHPRILLDVTDGDPRVS